MENYYTENLAEFGARERHIAGQMLIAELPDHFYTQGVRIAFNKNSGNVFLTNDDYQVAMFNGGNDLEIFHFTPYSGIEGFISDLVIECEPDDMHYEDARYILDSANLEGVELPDNWKNFQTALGEL